MMSRIACALSYVPADDRDVWVSMGMAIKSEIGDDGFDLWDRWSQSAPSYREASAKAVWKSIKRSGGVTIGTLFHVARDNGWLDEDSHAAPITYKPHDASAEEAETHRKQASAARKASELLAQTKPDVHPYLKEKGLPDAATLVLPDGGLLVPMRDADSNGLIGAQVIRLTNNEWEKKFLPGQRSSMAVYRIGMGTTPIFCEGLATGLSISEAVRQMRLALSVVVCFSAGNLTKVAKSAGKGFVLADNDQSGTGERAAIATGLPWEMPDQTGEDCNDVFMRSGVIGVCKLVQGVMRKK